MAGVAPLTAPSNFTPSRGTDLKTRGKSSEESEFIFAGGLPIRADKSDDVRDGTKEGERRMIKREELKAALERLEPWRDRNAEWRRLPNGRLARFVDWNGAARRAGRRG
jgi:hypothetical protein